MAKPIRLLDNANQIITLLSEIGSANISVIAAEIGIPRSSTYRLVEGLCAAGLLRADALGDVRLAERWLHLSDSAGRSFSEWQGQINRLDEITEHTGYTSFLSIPSLSGAACIAWSPAKTLIVLSLRPGSKLPYSVGAAGRLLFAFSPEEESVTLLERASFPELTERSISSPEQLVEDAERTRRRGWVLSEGDVTSGVSAVGVPVYASVTGRLGCLSVAGLTEDVAPQAESLASYLSSVKALERLEQ